VLFTDEYFMDTLFKADVNELTESLKERFRATNTLGSVEFDELSRDVFDALDLLVTQNDTLRQLADKATWPPEKKHTLPQAEFTELAGRVADVLDDSLSQWQVQIEASCTQAISRDLREQISLLRNMTADLDENQRSLNIQRQATEAQMAEALRLKSRYARQRKTLAMELRAQRAEQHLAIVQERMAMRQELEATLRSEFDQILATQTTACVQEVELKLEAQKRLAHELRKQLDETAVSSIVLQEECCQLRQVVDSIESDNAARAQLQSALRESQELLTSFEEQAAQKATQYASQLAQLTNELSAVRTTLSATQRQLEEVQGDNEVQPTTEHVEQLSQELSQRQLEISTLRDQLSERAQLELELTSVRKTLQHTQDQLAELEELRHQETTPTAPQDLEQLERLQAEIYEKQQEIQDLRSQNSDLASQVAKNQVMASGSALDVSFIQESLTWEERKQLILQQFEHEIDDESNSDSPSKQIEVQDIISATQLEIERRDREIEELQSIIQQQSNTREGVAIGAAAIAQMIDSDELVNQERQKLKAIQQEWEQKLRKAEIDLSLERAKLARERTLLESERSEILQHVSLEIEAEDGETKAQTRTRKWLQHLGLKQNEQ
jgi:hypothetical protein